MSTSELTRAQLEHHPVWRWDDDMEGYSPVPDYDPLPADEATLFIRAKFTTPSGTVLDGYLIGAESFYAVGLFVGDEDFVLNLNLPEMIAGDLSKIRTLLGEPNLELFPMRYEDHVGFKKSPPLRGMLDK